KLDRTPDDQVSSQEAPLPRRVDDFEKGIIIETLENCGWNKSETARRMGIPEGTLRSKMKKLEISRPAVVSQDRH
ncbi:MAG: helix-turn-helix domain-containing protein, partial [Candidatus Zixiibacteriota bacterium]